MNIGEMLVILGLLHMGATHQLCDNILMLKILKGVILLSVLICIAERFFLIPFDVSLDTKPNNSREAVRLAKSVGKEVKCIDGVSAYDVDRLETYHIFNCTISSGHQLYIYVFFDSDMKYKMLQSIKQKDYVFTDNNAYYKLGKYYIVIRA